MRRSIGRLSNAMSNNLRDHGHHVTLGILGAGTANYFYRSCKINNALEKMSESLVDNDDSLAKGISTNGYVEPIPTRSLLSNIAVQSIFVGIPVLQLVTCNYTKFLKCISSDRKFHSISSSLMAITACAIINEQKPSLYYVYRPIIYDGRKQFSESKVYCDKDSGFAVISALYKYLPLGSASPYVWYNIDEIAIYMRTHMGSNLEVKVKRIDENSIKIRGLYYEFEAIADNNGNVIRIKQGPNFREWSRN